MYYLSLKVILGLFCVEWNNIYFDYPMFNDSLLTFNHSFILSNSILMSGKLPCMLKDPKLLVNVESSAYNSN